MDKTIKTEKKFIENIISAITSLLSKKQEDKKAAEKQHLLDEIEQAISDIHYARNCFSEAKDPEMIEACIYEIKSAEARYNFLLKKAKRLAELELSA